MQAWIGGCVLVCIAVLVTILTAAIASVPTGTGGGDGRGWPASSSAAPSSAPSSASSSAAPVDRTRVDGLLGAHAAALLSGDEAGWLDVADPTRPDVVAWYRQLYSTLRALQVTWFEYRVPREIADGRPGPRPEQVFLRYCLGGVACDWRSHHAVTGLRLQFIERDGRWFVTDVPDRADGWNTAVDPPPWLVDPLQVHRQGSVIVAAPAALAGRSSAVLAAAVRATAVVDRYTRPAATPPTYLIYLAGAAQWSTWHDGLGRYDAILGVAVPMSSIQIAVVLRMDRIDPDELDATLRHEMGHVVTLFGEPDSPTSPNPANDWAGEGIAEYISRTGLPRATYPRLRSVRAYLRAGRWDGALPIHINTTDRQTADATYGLGYLVIGYLADTYGEPAMLRLVDDLLRNGASVTDAARTALGHDWPIVAAGIAAYLRQVAR
ncbi:hypothetical protein [Virgisporangium aurantiacum]|nr:hypothetical protein [Virgisporangium aurantiacum]